MSAFRQVREVRLGGEVMLAAFAHRGTFPRGAVELLARMPLTRWLTRHRGAQIEWRKCVTTLSQTCLQFEIEGIEGARIA